MEIIRLSIDALTPDPTNAKDHPHWQIEQIKNSIEQFGNLDPIGVWGDDNLIVEGHGRYEALKELGYTEAECIRLDWLTEDERRAYALAHNKLTMNSGFIPDALDLNLDAIGEIDMSLFGFKTGDWFQDRIRGDDSRQEGNEEYNNFLDKFEEPKTTDDCYTPDIVYDAVAEWVENEYGVNRGNFVRPFYPGGDYQSQKYKKDAIVVDNPPFSILSEILRFYDENNIKFFLFAPTLTLFSSSSSSSCSIVTGVAVIYENGANVNTSFLTNLENYRVRSAPTLYATVDKAAKEYAKELNRELPKYVYPNEVMTSTDVAYLSKYGESFRVSKNESYHIRQLESQKEAGKAIFGSGYLLSEKAAAEKAAAEKAAAEKAAAEKAAAEKAAAEKAAAEKAAATKWPLSDREKEIIKQLSGDIND